MVASSRRQSKAAAPPGLQTRPAMSWADAELYEDSGYIGIHDLVYSREAAETYLGPLVNPDGTCDIPIRNKLVKHAALAYLRPMSASSSSRLAPRRKPPSVLQRLLDPLYDAVRCLMEVVCHWDADLEEETERNARRLRLRQ